MESWMMFASGVLTSLLGSSGLWAYLQRKESRKGGMVQLLRGLAHERIIDTGMKYIDRGYVTKDEYDDFMHYLYNPYSEFGGNGLAEKIKDEVSRLPIRGATIITTAPVNVVVKDT